MPASCAGLPAESDGARSPWATRMGVRPDSGCRELCGEPASMVASQLQVAPSDVPDTSPACQRGNSRRNISSNDGAQRRTADQPRGDSMALFFFSLLMVGIDCSGQARAPP